jgi:hypothetical protein
MATIIFVRCYRNKLTVSLFVSLSLYIYICIYVHTYNTRKHDQLHTDEPFLRSHERNSKHFVESEGSLQYIHVQVLKGPYPKPDISSPHPSIIFLKIYFNDIFWYVHKSFEIFFVSCSNLNILCMYLHLYECYMSRLSLFPWLYHPSNILWRVQVMKIPITQHLPASYWFIPLRSKYSRLHRVINHPQSMFFLKCER